MNASEGDECGDGSYSTWSLPRPFWHFWARASCVSALERWSGGEVSGVVRMPEICSPAVSPAVVYLTPVSADRNGRAFESVDGSGRLRVTARAAELALVNQRGLQFVPRVQAIALGQTVRFTNQDSETHNVHVVSPGFAFNQSMAPGQPRDFTPDHPGVMRLACDIHHHMRGFVVVSPTPWVQVCDRDGRFRLEGVPAGHYVLNVWHEMGDPLRTEIDVIGRQERRAAAAGPDAFRPDCRRRQREGERRATRRCDRGPR